jgi:hypothetical protein
MAEGLPKCLQFLPTIITRKLTADATIRYVELNITENIIHKPDKFTETRTQEILRLCDFISCNLIVETFLSLSSIVLSNLATEITSIGTRIQTLFRNFELSLLASWFEGISNPSLV